MEKNWIFRIVCYASNLMQSRGLQCSFLLSFKFCFLYLLFRNKITSLGQRRGFSSLDIQKLNKLYQCQNLVTCKDFYTPQSGLCQTWKTKGGCERSFHISCPSCLPFLFSKFLAPFVLYYSSFAAVPHLLQKCLHICSAFFSL